MPTRSASPLPEDEFWELIALLDGQPYGEPVQRLTAELERAGDETSRAFAERLALVLFDLDRESLADRTIRWADAPHGAPIPLSDDGFLYLRAAVVAAGRDAVAAAIADPAFLESRLWDDGEELLYAAGDHETTVSYETGSNPEHWPPLPPSPARERDAVVVLVEDGARPVTAGTLLGHFTVWEFPYWLDRRLVSGLGPWAEEVIRTAEEGAVGWSTRLLVLVHVRLGEAAVEPAVEDGLPLNFEQQEGVQVVVGLDHDDLRRSAVVDRARALSVAVATGMLAVLPAEHAARREFAAVVASGGLAVPPRPH